jgi:serine/threonine protein phosphatase 1
MTGSRCFVVGDVHGCLDELEHLLGALAPEADDLVVFLGDYIYRGPASKEVISRLLRLRHEGPQCVFLKGNHEDMFLSFMGFPGKYGESFLYNGGDTTLRSYGLQRRAAHEIAQYLPPDHLEFLRTLQMHYVIDDFLCVHAGLNPLRPLAEQADEDLLWIRGAFIQHPHALRHTVLFGHTPRREVLIDLPYKIGLDTGLVYGNRLSCFETSRKDLFQIGFGTSTVRRRSLQGEFDALVRR